MSSTPEDKAMTEADDVQFDQAPRDSATDVPLNYKQPMFSNKATSSSKVELTWDQDDPDRFKLRKKKFTKDDINEHDLQAYLASDSEDGQEGQPGRDGRDKLRALLEQPAEAAAEGSHCAVLRPCATGLAVTSCYCGIS